MLNFVFHNPTKIVFGKDTISELKNLISADTRILMTYGGGSIKKNGVYDQVKAALDGYTLHEFGGIEPNPRYETLMKAVEICKREDIDFLLAVGGGSVLDGTKFIAAATYFRGDDPWEILSESAPVESAVPIGSVLTLAATGSESNGFAVISRESTDEKLAFGSPHTFPRFSILDPQTTTSLPERQTINGIVDAYVHVCEQYVTFDTNAPLQARQAEAILKTLIEIGPQVLAHPYDYDVRANLMWCATQALNGLIGCGVAHDWSTHMIGHELTALYGIDHAQSLAVVMPAVWRHERKRKAGRLKRYVREIFQCEPADDDEAVTMAINKTVEFFHSVKMPTKLRDYNITGERFDEIAERLMAHKGPLGEHQAIGKNEVVEILKLAL